MPLSLTGIIPTRVGTSHMLSVAFFRAKDHPHACGDKGYAVNALKVPQGSSPRVWGQDFPSCTTVFSTRIIPTRVGTSYRSARTGNSGGDHPHACGDKSLCFEVLPLVSGSSPRVWGQAILALFALKSSRIIPTRVGTSNYVFQTSERGKDHPHACGDKGGILNGIYSTKGSSPRVWGQAFIV